jgi:hypothetical protein
MNPIRKTDTPLSVRQRTEIHLVGESDATGFPYEEPAGADPEANDSTENPPDPSPAGGRRPTAMAAPKSVRD